MTKKSRLPIDYKRKDSYSDTFNLIMETVEKRYEEIVQVLDRSHASLYGFLGCIYENAAKINGDTALRPLLAAEVERMLKDVKQAKRRWDADSHDTFDLLLTLRFKLASDTAALKCGWLAALRAAKDREGLEGKPDPVETTEVAFVDWISPMGVVGAQRLAKKRTGFDLSSFVEGLPAPEKSLFSIELPADAEPAEGIVVVICRVVKQEGRKVDLAELDIVTNRKRVASLTSWMVNENEREQKRSFKEIQAQRRKDYKRELDEPGSTGLVPPSVHKSVDAYREYMDKLAAELT